MLGFDPQFVGLLQQTFSVRGTLDDQGEHEIEAEVRKTLATGQDPLANPQDRYSLSYRNRFLDVRLGDQLYSLSPLLLSGQYARGVEAIGLLSSVRFGALYFADVQTGSGAQGLGGFAEYTLPRSTKPADLVYRANLSVLAPLDDRVLFGLWQQYRPWEWVQVQFDTALQMDGSGIPSPAVLALARAETRSYVVTGRFIRAWPEFDGAYHDSQSVQATARALVFDERLVLHGSFSLTDSNLDLDPTQAHADRSQLLSLGFEFMPPGWGTDIALDAEHNLHRDRLPSPDYSTAETLLRLAVRQEFEPYDVRFSSSLGHSLDELTDAATWVLRNELSVAYDPPDILRYLFALRHIARWTEGVMAFHSLGWSLGGIAAAPGTKLDAQLRNDYSFAGTGLSSLSFGANVSLSHTFPWGHDLSAAANFSILWASLGWQPGFTLSATYGVPLDVPISRKKDIAIVAGLVHHAITGEPMADVLIRLNGMAALSDRNGMFAFYLPRAGKVFLQVDRASFPAKLIPVQRMPMEVEAVAGATVTVDLGLVEGASVSGTVAVYGFLDETTAFDRASQPGDTPAAPPDRIRLGGLANMIVELANGGETRRKATGPDGTFAFTEVRPGHYTIRIIGGRIPSYHQMEEPSRQIDLAPEESRNVEFRVLQDRRRIQFVLSDVSVVLEQPAAPEGGQTVTLGGAGGAEGASKPGSGPAGVPEAAPPGVEPSQAQPRAVEPTPVEPTAVVPQPAPVEPVPVEPELAPPVQPAPGPRLVAPDTPSHEALIMAAQAGFNAPAPTWDDILSVWLPGQITATGTPKTSTATVTPAAPPAAAVPATPAPAAPSAKVPALTVPTVPKPAPTKPVPVPPGPGPDASADNDPHPVAHADSPAPRARPRADAHADAIPTVDAPWTLPALAFHSSRSSPASTRRSNDDVSAC